MPNIPKDLPKMSKPRDYDDGFGYNKHALRIVMVMAGYEPTTTQLALLLRCSWRQAEYRISRGKFTRHDIAVLQSKLNLDGQQLIDVFFNGRYPPYLHREEQTEDQAEETEQAEEKTEE